ncbi:MAG: TadE/TadG family type IV pilus assembly protein [Rhizomicrobium sp.]|jgi:Flp pilus assembly protein TadG
MSAVEFALILPVMVLIYLGGFELTQALSIKRQVSLTASTVTNVVSQYTTISASQQMPDILNASVQVMTPYTTTNATVVVSGITISSTGVATVAWSQALPSGSARTVGSTVTLPAALDTPGGFLVFGETTYAYTPLIDYVNMGTISLYSSLYMLPRASTTINLAT